MTLCQAITQHFWRRWSNEYLQQLQKSGKWHNIKPPSWRLSPHDRWINVQHELDHGESHPDVSRQRQTCQSCGHSHRDYLQERSSSLQSKFIHQPAQDKDFHPAETNYQAGTPPTY